MATLNACKHCGAQGAEKTSGHQVYIECTNTDACGMRTPGYGASLDYGARQRVADIWNGPELWPDWIKPAKPSDGYPLDAKVTHQGPGRPGKERWVNYEDMNVHEPGVSGWRLVGPAADVSGQTDG